MGRTLPSITNAVLHEQQSLARFRRALRLADQRALDDLFAASRHHLAASALASHLLPFEIMLLSMLVEEHKLVLRLQIELERPAPAARDDARPRRRAAAPPACPLRSPCTSRPTNRTGPRPATCPSESASGGRGGETSRCLDPVPMIDPVPCVPLRRRRPPHPPDPSQSTPSEARVPLRRPACLPGKHRMAERGQGGGSQNPPPLPRTRLE